MHSISWIITVVLFFISVILYRAGQEKGGKMASMITRVGYLVIVGSGIFLLVKFGDSALHYVKTLLGLITIGMMELILAGISKNKKNFWQWGAFVAFLAATVYLGNYLIAI